MLAVLGFLPPRRHAPRGHLVAAGGRVGRGRWKITGAAGAAGQGLGRVEETYRPGAAAGAGRPGRRRGQRPLLIALLEAGDLDGALLARESPPRPWKGGPFLARTPDEVIECAGSFYSQTLALAALDLPRP